MGDDVPHLMSAHEENPRGKYDGCRLTVRRTPQRHPDQDVERCDWSDRTRKWSASEAKCGTAVPDVACAPSGLRAERLRYLSSKKSFAASSVFLKVANSSLSSS